MGNEGRISSLGPAARPAVTSMHAMVNAKIDIPMQPQNRAFRFLHYSTDRLAETFVRVNKTGPRETRIFMQNFYTWAWAVGQ